jgi:multiple sugar transport system ATP-binding protein
VLKRGILQQLASPRQLYTNPGNLFVAGFIGSPPMNFLNGELVAGQFVSGQGHFATRTGVTNKAVTAGLRPEDCRVTTPQAGKIAGTVYATELIGDHTLVTCRVGDATVTVKADKTVQHGMDEPIGVDFHEARTFLFDTTSGERIRPADPGAGAPG